MVQFLGENNSFQMRGACPTYSPDRDDDGWYFKSGTITEKVDVTAYNCTTHGEGSFDLGQDSDTAELFLNYGKSGTFNWGAHFDDYKNSLLHGITTCRWQDGSSTSLPADEDADMDAAVIGHFNIGDKELKNDNETDHQRVHIAFKTPLADYSNIQNPPALFGTIGGKPNQFIPTWLDNIEINTEYPTCE